MKDQDKKKTLADIFEGDVMEEPEETFKEDPEPEEAPKSSKHVWIGEDEDPEEDKWD